MIKNDLESYQPDEQRLHGIYRGVIEDNSSDPESAGRCKIRVFGVHTENKNKTGLDGIPTEELPWAEPALGLFQGSTSGYGSWSVPQQGSHVFVFFEAGHILQPRFFASVPGIPEESPDSSKGFSDPDGQYPDRTGEPDWSRLARGDTSGTAVEEREKNLRPPEPPPAYAAEYPYNNVFTTSSGITVEFDDTPGNERVHIYHPSNTYIEIDSEGKLAIRNTSDRFDLVDGGKEINILKNKNETIGQNYMMNVGGYLIINTSGATINTSGATTKIGEGKTIVETDGETVVNSSNIYLNTESQSGRIVTTDHLCQITGLPHNDGSSNCFAGE